MHSEVDLRRMDNGEREPMTTTPPTCPDTICTNCGKSYRDHYHESSDYCYGNTNGDLFTTEPTEEDKLRQQITKLEAELASAITAKEQADKAKGTP